MASLAFLRTAARVALLAAAAWAASEAPAAAERAHNLQVAFRGGQTFLTFTEVTTVGATYSVYRHTQAIASTAGLTPVATLTNGSGTFLYTGQRFVISNLGAGLPAGTGLLVYTTPAAGTFYYAVTNSTDASIVAGDNATTSGLPETRATVPGAVQIAPSYQDQDCIVTPYFAWEDYSTWDPAWGYYGYRFNVVIKGNAPVPGEQLPLIVRLHGAGSNGYQEPESFMNTSPRAVAVTTFDVAFLHGLPDPYTATGRFHSRWFGYRRRTGAPSAVPVTERRLVRYARLAAANPYYQIDSTRIYVTGASMGGGGAMHLGYHHGDVFAAVSSSIGWVDLNAWGGLNECEDNPPVESVGVPCADWQNQAWLVENASTRKPPIIYTFNKNDYIVSPIPFPNLLTKTEAAREHYVAEWRDQFHDQFWLSGAADLLRFRLNEPYPAFGNATSSSSVTAALGQRNKHLDWSSSLRSFGTGTDIVDAAQSFQMSFQSLNGSTTTADVTIRNAQQFLPQPGEVLSWTNVRADTGATIESGTATVNARALATVRIQIMPTGNRLRLQRGSGTTPPPAAPGVPEFTP